MGKRKSRKNERASLPPVVIYPTTSGSAESRKQRVPRKINGTKVRPEIFEELYTIAKKGLDFNPLIERMSITRPGSWMTTIESVKVELIVPFEDDDNFSDDSSISDASTDSSDAALSITPMSSFTSAELDSKLLKPILKKTRVGSVVDSSSDPSLSEFDDCGFSFSNSVSWNTKVKYYDAPIFEDEDGQPTDSDDDKGTTMTAHEQMILAMAANQPQSSPDEYELDFEIPTTHEGRLDILAINRQIFVAYVNGLYTCFETSKEFFAIVDEWERRGSKPGSGKAPHIDYLIRCIEVVLETFPILVTHNEIEDIIEALKEYNSAKAIAFKSLAGETCGETSETSDSEEMIENVGAVDGQTRDTASASDNDVTEAAREYFRSRGFLVEEIGAILKDRLAVDISLHEDVLEYLTDHVLKFLSHQLEIDDLQKFVYGTVGADLELDLDDLVVDLVKMGLGDMPCFEAGTTDDSEIELSIITDSFDSE